MKKIKNILIKQIDSQNYLTEKQKNLLRNFLADLSEEQILALMDQKLKPKNFINEAKKVNQQMEDMFAKILDITKEKNK